MRLLGIKFYSTVVVCRGACMNCVMISLLPDIDLNIKLFGRLTWRVGGRLGDVLDPTQNSPSLRVEFVAVELMSNSKIK